MAQTVRVAAAQFAVGVDGDENLRTCLRMIDRAAGEGPQLLVLPEFCNHASWYEDAEHCHRVALTLDAPFLRAIADAARVHRLFLVANVTLRRSGRKVSATSLLYGPGGELLGWADKQVLIGHENDFFRPAETPAPVLETPIGRLGLYACMDGVICETPRALALSGAQILCNSLNSFALDEGSLHVPVRAAENRVFVVAANKVGPLLPEAMLDAASAATQIPARFLHGAGESQIVAPDGTVLARAARAGEAVVTADIDVRRADDKRRPDGTHRFAVRRPELYRTLGQAPAPVEHARSAERIDAAVYCPAVDGAAALDGVEAIDAAVGALREADAVLVVLPELFCFAGAIVDDLAEAVRRSEAAMRALAAACRGEQLVATTLVIADGSHHRHEALLIGRDGVVLRQPQLHRSARHAWATPGERIEPVTLSWGRLALVAGDDALQPETFRLCAMAGVDVVALPFHLQESWELSLGLVERAAENRVCMAAASRAGGLVATLREDFTLMTPWKSRVFDGLLTEPPLTRAAAASGLTVAALHPRHAANKIVSHRTHLVDGRPWRLIDAITRQEATHG